jgi:hypothetical protein
MEFNTIDVSGLPVSLPSPSGLLGRNGKGEAQAYSHGKKIETKSMPSVSFFCAANDTSGLHRRLTMMTVCSKLGQTVSVMQGSRLD